MTEQEYQFSFQRFVRITAFFMAFITLASLSFGICWANEMEFVADTTPVMVASKNMIAG